MVKIYKIHGITYNFILYLTPCIVYLQYPIFFSYLCKFFHPRGISSEGLDKRSEMWYAI